MCASDRSGCKVVLAHSPRSLRTRLFVPLAIEYTFWNEPRPEILVSFGEPIIPGNEDAGQRPGVDQTI